MGPEFKPVLQLTCQNPTWVHHGQNILFKTEMIQKVSGHSKTMPIEVSLNINWTQDLTQDPILP